MQCLTVTTRQTQNTARPNDKRAIDAKIPSFTLAHTWIHLNILNGLNGYFPKACGKEDCKVCGRDTKWYQYQQQAQR